MARPEQTRKPWRALALVEGPSDLGLIRALLRHERLFEGDRFQLMEVGGRGFAQVLRDLHGNARYPTFAAVGLVCDAEACPENTVSMAVRALRELRQDDGWPPPPPHGVIAGNWRRAGFLVVPSPAEPGSLETLCLQSVAAEAAMGCVSEYFECLRANGADVASGRDLEKNQLQAYLCGKPESGLTMGRAADVLDVSQGLGYWNWSHAAFDPLIRFLHDLAAAVAAEEAN